jgi:hypothetical protein
MKKIILVLSLVIISTLSFAQVDTSVVDSIGIAYVKQQAPIKTSIVFSKLSMDKDSENGQLSVTIIFNQYDSLGVKIDNLFFTAYGQDYNTFWQNWTTGKYLYQQLQLRDSKGNLIPIPGYVERDFINE